MVAKRLERFFISKDLLDNPKNFKLWVSGGGISDHMPILLKIDKRGINLSFLFKLNQAWLREEYINLVRSTWTHLKEDVRISYMHQFVGDLSKIKIKILEIQGADLQFETSVTS